jgi:hypothetical protein
MSAKYLYLNRTALCTLLLIFIAASFSIGCKEEKNYITQQITPPDWQGPTVEWTSPMDAEVRGTIGLDVSVHDSSSILRVKLYINGREDQTVTEPPYRFTIITDSFADGVHLCEARAWDQYENLGISPVLRVNVVNSIAQGPRLIWVPDDFTLIQAAINAVQDFDTIRVRNGIYYETLNLFGKGIWIESENGPLRCTINAAGARSAFYAPESRELSTIIGFYLTGGYYQVYLQNGSRGSLYNNILASDTAHSLLVTGDGGGIICNNLFDGSRTAVQIQNFWGTFNNNIVMGAGNFGLWNSSLDRNPLQHDYNLYWNNSQDYAGFEPGIGDIHADPLLDLANGRLFPGSPAIDAGDPAIQDKDGSRSDIGPFGGPYAY